MQLDAGVVRAREAAAAQAAGRHAEVAAVLLHHHVGGHLAGAEQRVLRLVDARSLGDAVGEGRVGVVPARLELLQRRSCWAGRRRPCWSTCGRTATPGRPPRGFEQVQRADGVGVEVVERDRGGAIVARLGRRVDDGVGLDARRQLEHAGAIADVELVMVERGASRSSRCWFQRVSPLRPKKTAR